MNLIMRIYNRVRIDKKIQKRRRHTVSVFNKKNRFKNFIRCKNSEAECVKVGLVSAMHVHTIKYTRNMDRYQKCKHLGRDLGIIQHRTKCTSLEKENMMMKILDEKYPDLTLKDMIAELVWLGPSENMEWDWDRDLQEGEF